MKILIVLLTIIYHVNCERRVYYWDTPPYIWKDNQTGVVKGSIPYMYNMMKMMCNYPHTYYYQIQGQYPSFKAAIENKKKYVETDDPHNSTQSTNITGLIYWFPYPDTTIPKMWQTTTYVTSKKMAVIVPREKIEITYKIIKGTINALNFLLLCLFLALNCGVIIWLLVGVIQSINFQF